MVRPLVTLTQHLCSSPSHTITLTVAFLAIFFVLSVLTLLCASHNKIKKLKTRRSQPCNNIREKRLFPGFSGNIGVSGKALLKMVSWQRVQDDEEEEEEAVESFGDEDAVWRKAIIMGERCRPFDFEGKIEYDCEGNPLPSSDDKRVVKIEDDHKDVDITNK